MNKQHRVWPLQEAKAKFSEVVRRAQAEGPQTVTVHGAPAVIITAVPHPVIDLAGKTGADLIKALQTCPYPEFFDELEERRVREPVILKPVDIT
jgi:prevent-host-death family protein